MVMLAVCNHREQWLGNSTSQLIASLTILMAMVYAEYGQFAVLLFTPITNDHPRPSTFTFKHSPSLFYLIMANEVLLPHPTRFSSLGGSLLVICIHLVTQLWWPLISENGCRAMSAPLARWSSLSNQSWIDESLSTVAVGLSSHWGNYLAADVLFYIITLTIAFYVTYLMEIINRRTFLDHRKCVESKYLLTFERNEQERLLASCLPRHLMRMVRDDIWQMFSIHMNSGSVGQAFRPNKKTSVDCNNNGTHFNSQVQSNGSPSAGDSRQGPDSIAMSSIVPKDKLAESSSTSKFLEPNNNGVAVAPTKESAANEQNKNRDCSSTTIFRPFNELYIDKHDNVTIVYADIVNSMLLTETFATPKQLIQTLNDLFGHFDTLAEVYGCLRIKLLGDCYYCVSGVPNSDPKHALNSLMMALDMMDSIGQFKLQNDNLHIDMRVGVHSGTVMSGLLGLKKWQYDIWSVDVMKAARMEHDGTPGWVHVTRETLNAIPVSALSGLVVKGE